MTIDIDGFSVLRDIGTHRELFAGLAKEVNKSARTLVIKHIRENSTELNVLRCIREAIGSSIFKLIIDGMSESQTRSSVIKLDKYHSELKAANIDWQRRHLYALAEGILDPAPKPTTLSRRNKPRKTKASPEGAERISFSSAGATRKR